MDSWTPERERDKYVRTLLNETARVLRRAADQAEGIVDTTGYMFPDPRAVEHAQETLTRAVAILARLAPGG